MDGYNADLESMNSAVSDMGSIMTDMSTIVSGRLKQVEKLFSLNSLFRDGCSIEK